MCLLCTLLSERGGGVPSPQYRSVLLYGVDLAPVRHSRGAVRGDRSPAVSARRRRHSSPGAACHRRRLDVQRRHLVCAHLRRMVRRPLLHDALLRHARRLRTPRQPRHPGRHLGRRGGPSTASTPSCRPPPPSTCRSSSWRPSTAASTASRDARSSVSSLAICRP